jgi:DNA processing protein
MFGYAYPEVTAMDEQASLLALTEVATALEVPWHRLSLLVEEAGGIEALVAGDVALADPEDQDVAKQLVHSLMPNKVDGWRKTLDDATADGITRLITVDDSEYPENLRRIYNHPPFLFVRGTLLPQDTRSIAIVGTRRPQGPEGPRQARELASELARRGVTVVSGMAAGIDTVAHTAALEAGGRTIAVLGTGIDKVFPKENAFLATRIPGEQGALISQFWPGAPPSKISFPMRNVVTSGISLGTVVVEANGKSGARLQARLAIEHGKRVFLVRSLVLQEEWARKFAERRGVKVVETVDEVLPVMEAELEVPQTLAF